MLKLLKLRKEALAECTDAFAAADPDAAFMEAIDQLAQDIDTVQPISRVEYELKRLDVKIDVLEAEDKSVEAQIAALQAESRAIKKVLKSDILKRRELMTDESYDPAKDGAGSHAVAIDEKRKKGDKHWPAKIEAAA